MYFMRHLKGEIHTTTKRISSAVFSFFHALYSSCYLKFIFCLVSIIAILSSFIFIFMFIFDFNLNQILDDNNVSDASNSCKVGKLASHQLVCVSICLHSVRFAILFERHDKHNCQDRFSEWSDINLYLLKAISIYMLRSF